LSSISGGLSSELHCNRHSVSQSVSQSIRLGIESPSGARDQILAVVRQLQDELIGRLP